ERAKERKKAVLETEKALAGEPLPDLKLVVKTLDGKKLDLADLKGKVVIVDVWGTWCPPCRNEIPHFVQLYADWKEKGLEIVGVAFENGSDDDAAKLVQEFAEKEGIKYPLSANGQESPLAASIPGFGTFPTTFFIDREGKVRLKKV